jgi:ABC-2 type transport system permease protein
VRALSVYAALARASIRSQLRYKASMIFNFVGYFIVFWSEFIAIWILFRHFGTLGSWSVEEVAVCYGIAHLSFAIAELASRGFDQLADIARAGDYDRYLLRPIDTAVQLAGFDFALHKLGRVAQSLIVLVAGVATLGGRVAPAGLLILPWAVLGGAALFSGVFVLQGAAGMKALQNIEAFNILTNGGPQMAQFPMSIYPRPMRLAFTLLVPLAGVVYYPAVSFLGRSGSAPLWLGWATPLSGFAFLAVSLSVFYATERSYISTGS